MNHSETTNFIWNIANLIRDSFRRSKYPDVILPFTVLRRIDAVLAPTKPQVLETNAKPKMNFGPTSQETCLNRFPSPDAEFIRLDRQLQTQVRQFEQTRGMVENIDQTAKQLKEALESGKHIIVTTLQKFPVIARQIDELAGSRFAASSTRRTPPNPAPRRSR